jgi:hypothetical protein
MIATSRVAWCSTSANGTERTWVWRQSMSALPHFSDVDLLRYSKRIIDLNTEITDCALDFGVAEQELNCSKVSRFLVD